MNQYFGFVRLVATLVASAAAASYCLWLFIPYPPAVVAVAAVAMYLSLAFVGWPLDAFVNAKALRDRSLQLAEESIHLTVTWCDKYRSQDRCRTRHVHWGELLNSQHASVLMTVRAYHVVTERFLRTAQAAWKVGAILSMFVLLITVTVFLDGSHVRVWPGSMTETFLTGGTAFLVLTAMLITLASVRRHNRETYHTAAGTLSTLQTHPPDAAVFDAFMCYNSGDRPAVRVVTETLRNLGVRPWLDEERLPLGRPWQPELERAIAQVRAACVFVGASGFGPWQSAEIQTLLDELVTHGRPVIPIILPDARAVPTLPLFLRQVTWLDLRSDEEGKLFRLASELRSASR